MAKVELLTGVGCSTPPGPSQGFDDNTAAMTTGGGLATVVFVAAVSPAVALVLEIDNWSAISAKRLSKSFPVVVVLVVVGSLARAGRVLAEELALPVAGQADEFEVRKGLLGFGGDSVKNWDNGRGWLATDDALVAVASAMWLLDAGIAKRKRR